jgi:hypothetical protein
MSSFHQAGKVEDDFDVQVLKLHSTVKSVEPRGGSSIVEVSNLCLQFYHDRCLCRLKTSGLSHSEVQIESSVIFRI